MCNFNFLTLAIFFSLLKMFSCAPLQLQLQGEEMENYIEDLIQPQEFPEAYEILRNADDRSRAECHTFTDDDDNDDDDDNNVSTRNGIVGKGYRWESFNVFVDPAYDESEWRMISTALYQIKESFPCIRYGMWPFNHTQPKSGDFVFIQKNSHKSCWSRVGKRGGLQEMSMRPECMFHALLVHELLHAIGLEHEHSRFDRDDFVEIHKENIAEGMEHAFKKTKKVKYDTFGIPYNQNSVMHYFGDSFSKNGKPTITAKNGKPVGMEWPSGKIQESDVEKLKKMYNC